MFSLLGGSLFAVACGRDGPGPALTRRLGRLAAPLLAAGVIVLPAAFGVWLWGWASQGDADARRMIHGTNAPIVWRGLTGPAHLWYLVYLLLITPIGAAVWSLIRGRAPAVQPRVRPIHPLATLAWLGGVALVGAACAAGFPDTLASFRNSIIPAPGRLLLHGALFGLGMIAHGGERLRGLTRAWPAALALAGAAGWLAWRAAPGATWGDGARGAYVALASAGLLGACVRVPSGVMGGVLVGALRSRLDRAAFAIYLFHLPLCAAAAVLLAPRAAPWIVIGASVLAGVGGGLLVHAGASRFSWGWVLGGTPAARANATRNARPSPPEPAPHPRAT
jgi:peptidoglycan/LPS O-acetylase OafA/YrhL